MDDQYTYSCEQVVMRLMPDKLTAKIETFVPYKDNSLDLKLESTILTIDKTKVNPLRKALGLKEL